MSQSDEIRKAKIDRTDDDELLITGIRNPDVSVVVNAETGEVQREEGAGGIRVVGIKDLAGGYTMHLGSCDW